MALAQILGLLDQFNDNQGNPAQGGLVNIYEPNTLNRVTSYQDSGIVVANTNPVKLSGSGRANVWVTRNVDVRVTDKDGNLIVEELSVNPDDLGGEFESGLIPNGSFEIDADASDVPDGWLEENGGAGNNNGLDQTESTSGGQSWRTQSAGSGGGELVTEAFFPVNDVDDLRVNFDLRSTVATVRNIVRVEWYDISQVFISNSDVYDSTANPATFTSQVLQATPPAGARFAKLRIFGGTAGGILAGITYWDRFNVFYPQIVSGVFDNITISGNDIISTNTNGDINITPNGTGGTVVKNLEALILAQLGFAGEVTLEVADANHVRIRADIVTATPPVAEAVTAEYGIYDLDSTDELAVFGFDGSNIVRLVNRMEGGLLQLVATQVGATVRTMLVADPAGGVTLNHDGEPRLRSLAAGAVAIISTADLDTENRLLNFEHLDGTRRAAIGHFSAAGSILRIRNEIHSGLVEILGEETGGAERIMIAGDPDGRVLLRHPGDDVIRAATADTGAFDILSNANSDAGTRVLQLTHQDGTLRADLGHLGDDILLIANRIHSGHVQMMGENAAGAERLLFTGDPDGSTNIWHPASDIVVIVSRDRNAAGEAAGAEILGADGVFHPIGYNVLPRSLVTGATTLDQGDIGSSMFYDQGTARTITFPNDSDIPLDAYGHIRCGEASGVLTLDAATGVTFHYFDGAAYVSHTAGANLELGDGSYTWWKDTDTEYYIDGPNITTA